MIGETIMDFREIEKLVLVSQQEMLSPLILVARELVLATGNTAN